MKGCLGTVRYSDQVQGRQAYRWLLLNGLDGVAQQRSCQVLLFRAAIMSNITAAVVLLAAHGAAEAIGCCNEARRYACGSRPSAAPSASRLVQGT